MVVKEDGVRPAGDIWKVSHAHGAVKEDPDCIALSSLLWHSQKNPVLLVTDSWVRMSQ